MANDVCGVKWCAALVRGGKKFCPTHLELPVLPGEDQEAWLKNAPVRAARAVATAKTLASIRGGKATTMEIVQDIEETPYMVRLAIKALLQGSDIMRTGRGTKTRYVVKAA